MARIAAGVLVACLAALGAVLLTQEPTLPAIAAAIASVSVAAASLSTLLFLRSEGASRRARARASRTRALRRGVEVGGIVAIVCVLQLIRGLTPLTALFVVLSFAIAEYVASAGASPSS